MQKIELLIKPVWNITDIMEYLSVSKVTAIKIKERAFNEYDGKVKYGTNLVKTDSVLALFATDREKELKLLRNIYEEII